MIADTPMIAPGPPAASVVSDPTPPAAIPPAKGAAPTVGGTTTIADRVIAKIASQAASETDHVAGPRRRLHRGPGSARPSATAVLDGRWARVTVEVAVDYPVSLRTVSRSVRAHVVRQVLAFAAVEARQVDVRITELLVADIPTRRVQ
jgi:uncharacterized alkaline shock family protein YloU